MTKEQNKKAPNLRFKGFTNDWEQRKLYEVADYRNGKAHEQHIYIHGNYIVVNSKFVSTSGKAKKYSDKLIEPLMKNEIAFVLSDVPNGKALARTFLVKRSQKYTLNQRVAGITPHPNMNSYFLFILMNRNPYFLKFDDGVGQTNLSKKDVEQFNENYPTKREQQKIGEIFVKLDSLLTLQQRKLELLKEIKKGLLQKMFADKSKFPILRFEGFHAEWEQRKLGEVIELEDNKRKPVKASKRIPGNIPYYGANGIQDYVKGYTHTGEHVLVAEDGANSISNYPVYFICSPSWINNHSHVLTGKGSIISNKFLTYNLKTVPYAKYLVGSGRYKLNAETLKIIPIKLPLLTEQNYIGSTLSKIDKLITLQHQRLSKLNEIKKSLLQQMFI